MFLHVSIYLLSCLFCVSGAANIAFSGFIEGATYYTHGHNALTELTCYANTTDGVGVMITNITWYYGTQGTGSNAIRFADVASEVGWGNSREYFCRAEYEVNDANRMNVDSGSITVSVKYNATISVSFDDITEYRGITDTRSISIPVLTQNVTLSCDAESSKWTFSAGINRLSNPLTFNDVFTIENNGDYNCIKEFNGVGYRTIHYVRLSAVGYGLWRQEQDNSYTKISEGATIPITEDINIVCVTSGQSAGLLSWFFRGESDNRISDIVEYNLAKGFLTLKLSKSLPTNRTGYYVCTTPETGSSVDSLGIHVVIPTDTATPLPHTTVSTTQPTPTLHTHNISLSFSYTPYYDVVFIGVDNITLVCTASIVTSSYLSVSIWDVQTGHRVVERTYNGDRLKLEHRVELLAAGNSTYTCVANNNTSRNVSIAVREVYEQEVTDLKLSMSTRSSVRLEWRTKFEATADEEFIISTANRNTPNQWKEVGRTSDTFYTVNGLSTGYDYSIRVQVMNRLNASSFLIAKYSHIIKAQTQTTTAFPSTLNIFGIEVYTVFIIALLGALLLLVCMQILCIPIIIVILCKRARNRRKRCINAITDNATRSPDYVQLSDVTLENSGQQRKKLKKTKRKTTPKNREYVPLELMPTSPQSDTIRESVDGTPEDQLDEPHQLGEMSSTPQHEMDNETSSRYRQRITQSNPNADHEIENGITIDEAPATIHEIPLPYDGTASKAYYEISCADDANMNERSIYCEINPETVSSDKVTPNKPTIQIDSIKQHIDSLWSNGMLGLRREFDELQLNLMRTHMQVAKLSCNAKFNRDPLMVPYDRSRVRLKAGLSSDYINASFIRGPLIQQRFIAAQLPMHATRDRFWYMLWEQKVSTVLMVTTRDESVHILYRYWPGVGSTLVEGELRIVAISEEDVGVLLVCHRVSVSLSSSPRQAREIQLLVFRGWPENEYCMMSNEIIRCLKYVRGVKNVSAENENVPPICVCCVTGCGRTGAVIALYNMLECVISGGSSVSLFNCVNGMRNHRPYMVQTLNQYKMMYMGLLEVLTGETRVDVMVAFPSEDTVAREFAELEYQCVLGFERSSNVGMQVGMNGDPSLPYDDTRVVIDVPLHTYYNASYVRSVVSDSVNDFIVGVSPTGGEEVSELIEIVFHHKCPLVVALEEHNNNSGLANYWDIASGVKIGSFQVKKLRWIEMEGLFISDLRLEHVTGEKHTFQYIYCSSTWSDEGVPSCYRSVLKMLDILQQYEHDRTDPVMFHCIDGAGASGVLLSVFLAVRGRRGCEVDLFQACKYLRFHRRRMVLTSEQYGICYEIVRQYLHDPLDNNYVNLAAIK